jgi:hypothetical protein
MMRKTNSGFIQVISLLFILTYSCQACSDPAKKDRSRLDGKNKVVLSVRTFKMDSTKTWGYEIFIDDKKYIHQEFIPALDNNRPFTTKKEALKVGRAVMQKIKNNKTPSLTKEEVIDILGIPLNY